MLLVTLASSNSPVQAQILLNVKEINGQRFHALLEHLVMSLEVVFSVNGKIKFLEVLKHVQLLLLQLVANHLKLKVLQ